MRPARASRFAIAALTLTALAVAACAGPTAEDCPTGRCDDGPGSDPPAGDPPVATADAGTSSTPPTAGDAGAGGGGGDPSCGEVTYPLTETQESLVVPAGVHYLHVQAWGAGGNGEGLCEGESGGLGGYTEGVFEVTPGMELVVVVGQRGRAGITRESPERFGFGAWGGGGLSGVFRGPGPITEDDGHRALLVAGGGGSAARDRCGPGGTGNHPDAGGAPSMHGVFGADEVAGGGGGYRGGMGGGGDAPARGGSGYVAREALDSQILWAEPGSGAPPATENLHYDGSAGRTETPGRVVVHFLCERPPLI